MIVIQHAIVNIDFHGITLTVHSVELALGLDGSANRSRSGNVTAVAELIDLHLSPCCQHNLISVVVDIGGAAHGGQIELDSGIQRGRTAVGIKHSHIVHIKRHIKAVCPIVAGHAHMDIFIHQGIHLQPALIGPEALVQLSVEGNCRILTDIAVVNTVLVFVGILFKLPFLLKNNRRIFL